MKPMLLKERGWLYAKKQKELGNLVPYQHNIGGYKNTDRQLEIREIFRKTNTPNDFVCMDFDEAESVVFNLNESLKDKPYEIHMPYTEGGDDWVIDFDNGLQAIVRTYDEYYGAGESSSGLSLENLIVLKDDIADEEIQKSAEWLARSFR